MKFTDESIVVVSLLLLLVLFLIIVFWLYNRSRFNRFKHQIPASIVNDYLDSIIQNSSALKSSLFRGGVLETGNKKSIPSVKPLDSLESNIFTPNLGGSPREDTNQRNAEISSLKSQLADKEHLINDLEERIKSMGDGTAQSGDNETELAQLKEKNESLEQEIILLKSKGDAPEDGTALVETVSQEKDALLTEKNALIKERDELKVRLEEYAIIEEDLANLNRLRQENAQLKATIEELGGEIPEPPSEEDASAAAEPQDNQPKKQAADDQNKEEDGGQQEPNGDEKQIEAQPPKEEKKPEKPKERIPKDQNEQKSAEELLNEFEKMLG